MKTANTAMKDAFVRAFHSALTGTDIAQPELLKRIARVIDRQSSPRRGAK